MARSASCHSIKLLSGFADQRHEKRKGGKPQSDLHRGPEGRDERVQVCSPRTEETDAGKDSPPDLHSSHLRALKHPDRSFFFPLYQIVKEPPKESVNMDRAAELFSQL